MYRSAISLTWLAVLVAGTLMFAFFSAAQGEDAEKKEPGAEIKQPPRLIDARQYRIGELIEDLAFTDIAGVAGKFSDFKGSTLVVVSTDTSCPLCKRYMPTLAEIEKLYTAKGVKFLFVNFAQGETLESARTGIEAGAFKSRYVLDPKGEIGRTLRALTTTDAWVLDASRTLRYRGAVDDQYGIGYMLDTPRENYLRDALDAVLAGAAPPIRATWAPGCDLNLELAELKAGGTVTWHNRISRIVQNNCQECHRSGESGPFELMTLENVKSKRAMIKKVVRNRTMPPWFPSAKTGHWRNDRSLSERDRADLLGWLEAGLPEGEAKDAAAPRAWTEGWRIGKPDVVLELPETQKIPAKGEVKYRYINVKTRFDEDKWVKAMEVRPGAPQVVHHVLVFLKYPRKHPRAKEQPQDLDGLNGYFMGMVPGQGHVVYAKGQAKFLPKGATLVFQIHYSTNGAEAEDKTKMGLIFNEGAPAVEIQTKGIANALFEIPAGADNHKVEASWTLPQNGRILSFDPHAHVRGKAWKYEVIYPDGKRETLLDIPRYDFNWQLLYELQEPLDLPKGSKILVTAWYDNSDKNPANPDPKKDIYFGEQTWEEMMIGYVNWHARD